MAESIKSVFDSECSHIKFDTKFLKRIAHYRNAFLNKNEDHVAFFGGNLLGVHPIRYRATDTAMWFDDVLEADDVSIKQRIHSLPDIVPTFLVSSDINNLSCLWLVHRIHTSPHLSAKEKEGGMIEVLLVLHYKLLSSLMAHYFKYPADREVAVATYAALSRKYALKVHGSWGKLLHARAVDIISRGSIHYKTVDKFNDDLAIVYMINDIQGRIREVVKKMWAVFDIVRSQDAKISTTSSTVAIDGEVIIRDKTRTLNVYKRYMGEVILNKSGFIRDELVGVIANAVHTMPERLLVQTLGYVSDNYLASGVGSVTTINGERTQVKVPDLIDEVLLHAFDFLNSNRNILRQNDLAQMISRLKSLYMSSRSTDPSLIKMRELGEHVVREATRSKNNSLVASVRTGLLLYIVLRTFTMKHYS